MADRQFRPLPLTNINKLVILTFSFAPQGSGTPTLSAEAASYVKSVTRSGTGAFTITLSDKYTALAGAEFLIAMSSATDLKPQLGAVDVSGAGTIALNVLAVATPTDIAANAANRIYCTLHLRNSSVAV